MKQKREDIKRFEEILNKATFGSSFENYNEGKYLDVSQIVQFMQSDTKTLKPEKLKKVTFMVGPSGAGKSTMLCDLSKENNLVIAENPDGELML